MTHLLQKKVNSIQFERGKVHVNHALIRLTEFEGKKPRRLLFFSPSQTRRESSELRNPSERPRKEIFGNSRIIFGDSDTRQDKNLMPLAQKKLAGIVFTTITGIFNNWSYNRNLKSALYLFRRARSRASSSLLRFVLTQRSSACRAGYVIAMSVYM